MPEVCHESVYFSGRVQGVGFRFQTLQVAKGFDVAGFVQNLDDGRVQVELEGTEREIGAMVAAIEDRFSGYIRKTERHASVRTAHYQGFTIR